MLAVAHTHSLADFLQDHQAHLERLRETRTPEVLTINGQAEVVLLDAQTYQELCTRLEQAEFLTAVRAGYAAAERGETRPAEAFFAEFLAQHGGPR